MLPGCPFREELPSPSLPDHAVIRVVGIGGVGSIVARYVAVFLASDQSSYITGQTIYPDGGRLGLNYTVPVPD